MKETPGLAPLSCKSNFFPKKLHLTLVLKTKLSIRVFVASTTPMCNFDCLIGDLFPKI